MECDSSPRTPVTKSQHREKHMTGKWNSLVGAGALMAFLCYGTSLAVAQSPQSGQSQSPQQQPNDKEKQPNPPPLKMDNAASAPSSPEEEAAYKKVQEATEDRKKTQLAEEFVQKYPHSRYRPAIYQVLVSGHFATQQVPKLLDAGEQEIELNPNDAPIVAAVAETLAP